jgi:hypothetical protein
MAVTKVTDLIRRAQTALQDATGVRWPVLELQDALNDAYRELVLARPDLNALTGTVACVAGTRQTITTAYPHALRVIDIPRNAGGRRRAVTYVERRTLDEQRPFWHGDSASTSIQSWAWDARQPRDFFVYPAAVAGTTLEVVYSQVPAPHTLSDIQLADPATTETIRVLDSFANAALDFMLYRAFVKDAEYPGNAQRALAHYQAFQAALATANNADGATRPMPNAE